MVFKSLQEDNKSCCQKLRRKLCIPDDVNEKIDLDTVRKGKIRGDVEFCYFTYNSLAIMILYTLRMATVFKFKSLSNYVNFKIV